MTLDTARTAYFSLLFSIIAIYIGTTYCLYQYRKDELLTKRGAIYNYANNFSAFLTCFFALNEMAINTEYTNTVLPCWFRVLLQYYSIPILVVLTILQRMRILVMYFNSQRLTSVDVKALPNAQKFFFRMMTFLSNSESMYARLGRSSVAESTKSSSEARNIELVHLSFEDRLVRIAVGIQALVSLVIIIILVSVSPNFKSTVVLDPQSTCLYTESMVPVLVMICISSAFGIYVGKLIRSMNDNLHFRHEVGIQTSVNNVLFLLFVLTEYADAFAPVKRSLGSTFFLLINMFINQVVRALYPYYYIVIQKKSLEGLKVDSVSYVKTLSDTKLYAGLLEYLKRELSMENALFLEACWRIYSRYGWTFAFQDKPIDMSHLGAAVKKVPFTPEDFLPQLMKLDEQFLKNNSDYQLNLPSKLINAVHEGIKNRNPTQELLNPIKEEVLNMVFRNTFPKLIKASQTPAINA